MIGKGSFVAKKNTQVVREEILRIAQEHIRAAVDAAKSGGITADELHELVDIFCEEDF